MDATTPPSWIARKRVGTQAQSSPPVLGIRSSSWHSPAGISSSPPQSEEANRIRNRTIELVDITRQRSFSEQNSPRLGSARQDSAYRASVESLKLAHYSDSVMKRWASCGDLWEEETSSDEDILNRIRELAQSVIQTARQSGNLESKLLTPLELNPCGLRITYPYEIRVLPVPQTMLFRQEFIAQGAQKKVWASTEISVKGTWAREVVEYEVAELEPGRDQLKVTPRKSSKDLKQFISGLGPSECFPPQGTHIGVGSTPSHSLFMQSIRFKGTALDIDPDEEFDRALRVFCNAARALCYLHAHRIVHRDVKGANIFIRGPCGYLGDLDDACWADEVKDLVDSAYYAAPELGIKGALNTYASDLWAFGITLWQGFYGRLYRKDASVALETVLPPFAQNLPPRASVSLCIHLDELSESAINNGLDFPKARFGKPEVFIQEAISGLLTKNPKQRPLMSHVVILLNKALKAREGSWSDMLRRKANSTGSSGSSLDLASSL